ncbi:phage tail protein [Haemophilus paraphrohaemolyticus]|uniref:phage tail protein n=1 Tax=Haemophilus paraphrohaemolyticus TaxID=736 RepID=UPI0028E88A9B|nr:phage tail protein [Haemophilus paraphrohaemolyticus]
MGKGGGGGGHTPVEAKETGRSKQFVKIVEVISEGEIEGLADGMKSVYLDNTPIQNNDDSYNFQNVLLEGRIGSQVQDIIPGFNTSEKEISVSTQVRKTTPITRTITDNKVSRLRLTLGVQSLFNQEDNGDTNGTSVSLVVYIGNASYPITISGKYSSQYLQQHTFTDLPSTPFTLRVERLTDDSKSQRLQNNTVWASYTEIIDTEFTYPNTALIGVKFDSEYFLNIPNRTYDIKGLKIKVPSNYNPETRQYTGFWDGTFKIEWSDNPAWVLYDVVTNKRYGLGQRLGEFGADKWALYQVAQYCDQLVPDGFGGQEPRFTCNVWLTEQRSAYQVINDICSIFRAMPVWNGQQLTVVMDRPADPVWTYTNANVDESGFSYTFSARKSRHNAIQVEYADKENSYEKAIEYVSDDESIRKNGLNVKKITAFGCTSRGQAHRTALWLLQTEKLETKTVTFTVGAEGLMHIPGDIIKVADTHYAGTNIGGRVLAVNGKTVTLDREITISGNSYLSYINANAKHQNIKIISVNGAEVTLDQQPLGLELYGVWSLATQQVTSQLFKALSVKEESKGKYTIMALQHEPQKEAIVDNGAKFEPVGTTVLTTPQISNIGVAVNADGSVSVDSRVTGGNGIVKYDIRIYKGGVLYDVRLGQPSPSLNIDGLENGDYSVLVQVKNENGQLLSEKTQTFTINKPPAPTGVRATGGLGNITLEWDWVDDVTATEIFTSETDDIKTAKRLTKVTARMYTHEVGAKQVRYYWLRHVRGQNVGAFHQQAGIRGESSVDIDKELKLLNEKLSQNIINEVFDTAAPARKLEMVKTVANLNVNQFQGVKQVYNERDGKLYLWNGSQYTSKIQASEIAGQLNQNQLDNELITQLNTAKDSATQAVAQSQEAKRKVAELSSEFNNINFDVGARNYLLNSAENRTSWTVSQSAKESWQGKKLTLSFSLNAKGIIRGGRNRVGLSMFLYYTDNTYTWIECWLSNHQGDYSGRLKSTIQLLDKPIKSISNCSFKVEVGGGTCVATHPKLEIGSIATDWSPAPEDLTTVIQFEDIKRSLNNESNARVAWENSANSRIGNAEATINQLGGTKANKDEVATVAAQALRSQWQSDAKAKVDEVSRAISSETKARTDWQRSAESKINRVDGFSARIDEINRTVTDVSGKVSATRTIKTQAIAGGRTAIAGIALGAANSGKDVESSVIVMADKFQVVKNAQDGSPKSMLSVVNDQIAINGDLIANGQITAPKLAVGAVRADHLAAGEISADKLAIGLGGNLLYNPIFANNAYGWRDFNAKGGNWDNCPTTSAFGRGYHKDDFNPKGEQTEEWRLISITGTPTQFNTLADRGSWVDICRQFVNVVADKWYIVSAYVGGFHCAGQILVEKYNADENQYLGVIAETPIAGQDDIYNKPANFITAYSGEFAKGLQQGARRIWVKFKAPDTGKILLVFRINRYAKNQTYGDFYLARPMLQECTEYATQPNEWQNAGVTAIHGGSIVTNSITAQQIAANTITGNEIVGGTIVGKHIAGKTITANHIVSKSITAEELSVESLSAISADLGAITGGSLKIGSLNGNFGTLFEVQSNGGFRLISRDASGGIELSSTTRALHVWDGGAEVVRVGKLS